MPEIKWTPEGLYLVTFILSAISGLGAEMVSNKPMSFKQILGIAIVYGGLGSGFGMTVVYRYLGGKDAPYFVIASGTLVGLRAIKMQDITKMLRKVFSNLITESETKRSRPNKKTNSEDNDDNDTNDNAKKN